EELAVSLAEQPERFGWYGMIEHGDARRIDSLDGPSTDAAGKGAAPSEVWQHGAGLRLAEAALIGYLRTSNLQYFRLADARVRHVMDVDTVHPLADRDAASVLGPSAGHWTGQAEPAAADLSAILLYGYLTGDARAQDVLDELTPSPAADGESMP